MRGWALPWFLALTVVSGVRVTVKHPSVLVTRGGSAVLPCSFQTSASLTRLNIIWTVSPLQEPRHPLQVISYEQGRVLESLSEYLGRVSFTSPPTREASILLNHTRASDTGTYLCTVLNPPDGATPNIGLVRLTVLVPPSSPDCSSAGPAQEGGGIQLRCTVTEGIPAPTFRWERISPNQQQLITSQEDYGGSVTLTNITSETSGGYRCTATNLLASRSCTIQIHAHAGGMSPLGICITLMMGLVLLALCALMLRLHSQSRGKRGKAALSHPARLERLSAAPLPAPRSDPAPCCTACRPLWMLPPPPAHHVYSIRRSQLSLTPVLETPSPPPPLSCSNSSMTTSEEEEEFQPALRSSLYSINSGFLV